MALLHLQRSGDPTNQPLFAIHGITAHGRRFSELAETHLSDRYVVAPDLRGHDESLVGAPWNLETHVQDLIDTLDHLGWASVDVIGHSLGGNLALRLLSAHPNRVNRLVLLDLHLRFRLNSQRRSRRAHWLTRRSIQWMTS